MIQGDPESIGPHAIVPTDRLLAVETVVRHARGVVVFPEFNVGLVSEHS